MLNSKEKRKILIHIIIKFYNLPNLLLKLHGLMIYPSLELDYVSENRIILKFLDGFFYGPHGVFFNRS